MNNKKCQKNEIDCEPASGRWLLKYVKWVISIIGLFVFSQAAYPVSVTLSINGAQTYQTIDGFGSNINSLSWTNENSKAAIDLLADQMGQTLWRVVFDMEDWEETNDNGDANTANWTYYNSLYSSAKFQNLWGTLRYLNQKGFTSGVALSFMGRVPSWMGLTTINASMEDEAVEMIATLLYYARNTEHVQFAMLDPFNEPDWDGIEGPQLAAAQYVRLLSKLSAKLDAMGLSDVRFLGPNTAGISNGVGVYLPAMMANSTVMNKIDHFGFHIYNSDSGGAGSAIAGSAYPSKNFWTTEYWSPADTVSLLSQNSSAFLVWEGFDSVYNHAIIAGRGSEPGNDDTLGSTLIPALLAYDQGSHTYTPRKEFYQHAQFFKFVPPGSVRIADTGAGGDISSLAFYHKDTGRVTIITRNTGPEANVSATLNNLPTISGFAYFVTDNSHNMSQGADVPVSASGTFSFSIPSGAIVTLSGNLTPSTATLRSITVAPANPSLAVGGTQQFTATGSYTDNSSRDVNNQVTWTSSAPTVATIANTGLVSVIGTGIATISATLGDVTGNTQLTVQPQALNINTSSLVGGTVGNAYSSLLTATGGTAPYVWGSSGLPTGLALNSSSGTIEGTPTNAGTYGFTVQVSDSGNPVQSNNKALSLTIAAVPSTNINIDKVIYKDSRGRAVTTSFGTSDPGQLLLAFVASDGPSSTKQTVTVSGAGLNWTLVRRTNSQPGTAEVWQAYASAKLTNISVQAVQRYNNFDQSLNVVAFNGARGIGANTGASAQNGSPSVSLTTTVPNSLVFGVGNDWDKAIARTLGVGQTMVHQWVDTGVGDTFWLQQLQTPVTVAGTNVTINDTAPITDRWNLTVVEVLPK